MSQNLKLFMKNLLRERGKNLVTVAKEIGVTHSRLYRMISPGTAMPADVRDAVTENLMLDEAERAELYRLIQENALKDGGEDFDEAFRSFVFGRPSPGLVMANNTLHFVEYQEGEHSPIPLSLHQFQTLLKCRTKLTVYVCNCFYQDFLDIFTALLPQAAGCGSSGTYEFHHLMDVHAEKWANRLDLVSFLFTHARDGAYIPYMMDEECDGSGRLRDAFLIISDDLCHMGEIQNNRVSLLSVPKNSAAAKFFINRFQFEQITKYQCIRDGYQALHNEDAGAGSLSKTLEGFSGINDTLVHLSKNYDSLLMKPNMCYDAIPPHVYASLIDQLMRSEDFINLDESQRQAAEACVSSHLSKLDMRYVLKNCDDGRRKLDIYNTGGLEEFSDTGRISDHFAGLPGFQEHVKDIIHSLLDNAKKNPSYTFKIAQSDFFDNQYVLTCYRGYGFMLEYNAPQQEGTYCRPLEAICTLKMKKFSEYFWDKAASPSFYENEFMPDEDALLFLERLAQRTPAEQK